jgi:dTDP-4-amino-4,6-dideoxygalactose transaminase
VSMKQGMAVPFVDLKAQYRPIANEINTAISTVLSDSDFILGEQVEQFEQEFARASGVRYAIGVDSGTSALELALRACHIGPGDEVITAANTFIATALAISYTGAKPVLVDVDPLTYNMDSQCLEEAITERTKAVIPVHLYGQAADLDPILELARSRHLVVIEDACQAHGATYKGKRVGSMGDAAAFSFYPAKNLGAFGDGGAVVTNDERIAQAVRMLRNYGQSKKYIHDLRGYNRRLDTLQAAVLLAKLKYLDQWNAARREHAQMYRQQLAGTQVITPVAADYGDPVWHLYVIRAQDRDGLRKHLTERGISTGIHYPVPIHLQQAYADLGYGPGSFPVTERASDQVLSLPMYAELTPEQIASVAEAIKEFAPQRVHA